jgi:hypothetical protein
MTRGLEARIARLEQAISAHDPLVVIFRYQSGELYGYECKPYGKEPLEVTRMPGESDEELVDRAANQAGMLGLTLNGCIALDELRR